MILSSLIIKFALLAGSNAHAETVMQKGTETVVEETTEVLEGKTVKKTRSGKVKQRQGEPQVGDLEDDEIEQVVRRQKSLNLTAFGFGPYTSSNIGNDKLLYGISFGKHWEVTTTGEIFADISAVLNEKGSFLNSALGFAFLPMTGQVSPVIGAGLGMGYGDGDLRDKGGFSGEFILGARLFRLSQTQMEIIGNYSTLFTEGTLGVVGAQLRVLY